MKNKVLYLGADSDILTPYFLVGNISELFIIDDGMYYRQSGDRWEKKKDDIKEQLILGSNINSDHRSSVLKYGNPNTPIHKLEYTFNILHEIDENNCWKLIIENKKRLYYIIYHHHTNYINPWPNDIVDINHIMSMGCPFGQDLSNLFILKQMVKERCVKDAMFYDYWDYKDGEQVPWGNGDSTVKNFEEQTYYIQKINNFFKWKQSLSSPPEKAG